MKYMIAGGGTGGHIFPAVAIAESLRERVPDARITFVGARYDMEKDLIPRLGYPLLFLPVRGFVGKSLLKKADLLWRLPASLILSAFYLIRDRPKVVIGVGGYASAPLLAVAWLSRIPTMVQEQNAFPGLVNRLFSRSATIAAVGFAEAVDRLHCPAIVTGNPIRKGFAKIKPWSPDRNAILVTGGSQGAQALNRILPGLFKATLANRGLRVVHQCGARHVAAVEHAYRGANFKVEVTPFIDNMGEMMEHVLFAVCRAGASTIAELRRVGVPAVLVPFPGAAHDHQTFNAKSLADSGAAVLVPERELAAAAPVFQALIDDKTKLVQMAESMPSRTAEAAAVCAEIVLALQNKRKGADIVREFETHLP